MDKELTDSVKEKLLKRIEELEVETIIQKNTVEVLKTMNVTGEQSQQFGQAMSQAESQYKLAKSLFDKLSSEYR